MAGRRASSHPPDDNARRIASLECAWSSGAGRLRSGDPYHGVERARAGLLSRRVHSYAPCNAGLSMSSGMRIVERLRPSGQGRSALECPRFLGHLSAGSVGAWPEDVHRVWQSRSAAVSAGQEHQGDPSLPHATHRTRPVSPAHRRSPRRPPAIGLDIDGMCRGPSWRTCRDLLSSGAELVRAGV